MSAFDFRRQKGHLASRGAARFELDAEAIAGRPRDKVAIHRHVNDWRLHHIPGSDRQYASYSQADRRHSNVPASKRRMTHRCPAARSDWFAEVGPGLNAVVTRRQTAEKNPTSAGKAQREGRDVGATQRSWRCPSSETAAEARRSIARRIEADGIEKRPEMSAPFPQAPRKAVRRHGEGSVQPHPGRCSRWPAAFASRVASGPSATLTFADTRSLRSWRGEELPRRRGLAPSKSGAHQELRVEDHGAAIGIEAEPAQWARRRRSRIGRQWARANWTPAGGRARRISCAADRPQWRERP